MDDLLRDLRFGIRILLKRPGTAALAIVALALGIGLTTTMFSIVNAAFLRGLPFEDSGRILHVGRLNTKFPAQRPSGTSLHDYVDWRAQQKSFEELAAWSQTGADVASDGVAPARYQGARLTPNALHVLRVQPARGRDFTEADAVDGAPPVALIGDAVWANQFRRDPAIVGRVIRINGEQTTVIGVMPDRFGFPQTASIWVPLRVKLAAKRGEGTWVDVFGRLRPGVSAATSKVEMATIGSRLAQQYTENKDTGATTQPIIQRFIGPEVILTLSTMLAAVFGVLLIACVNVTNLQLARAADRTKEVALRLALGASRQRMIRQLLVEGVVLAAIGALLGLGIAQAGITFFMTGIADTNPPFWIVARLDPTVLAFVVGLTVIAAMASSLVPAFRVTRHRLNEVLKDEGRAHTSLRVGRFSRILVVAEITLSFCLLVVSGLMIKSVISINRIDFPFRTDLFHARVDLTSRDYKDDAAIRVATERLTARLAGSPDVRQSALATSLPDRSGSWPFVIQGQPKPAEGAERPVLRRIAATPEFFQVLGVQMRQGRGFTERDREGAPGVAVVTEDFVRRFFPEGDAIGRQVQLDMGKGDADPWWSIVGVVPPLVVGNRNVTTVGDTIIVPLAQMPSRGLTIFAAGSADPTALTPAVRRAVQDLNPDLPLFDIDTVKGRYDLQTWPFRVFGGLFMTFGFAALVMAGAGLYGVMAFAVKRRTPEIGVRMALGADRSRILRMVLRQGVVLVAVGIVLGFGIGGWLGGQMRILLFRVEPWDAVVFGSTIGVLATSGLLACFIPALRAASVDPLVALRQD